MPLTCSLQALTNLDQSDPEAVQALLQSCVGVLLDPTLWLWAIGLTVACAVVGALIGVAKGRWLAGLAWGALLGPIGWVVIALAKSHLPECPECGQPNAGNAKTCRRCGVDLRAASSRSPRSRLKGGDTRRGW